MKKQLLTEAQQEIYDHVKIDGWFPLSAIDRRFKNLDSQIRKMCDKGFFESRLKPGTDILNLGIDYCEYRKIKKGIKEHRERCKK